MMMVVPISLMRLEQVHDLARHQRIEIARGLIGEHQLRIAGNGACDRHALLLAARQLRRMVLHARGQADDFQRIGDALVTLRGLHAAVAQRHVDVVVDVEVGHQVEALEDEADLLIAQCERASSDRAVTSTSSSL